MFKIVLQNDIEEFEKKSSYVPGILESYFVNFYQSVIDLTLRARYYIPLFYFLLKKHFVEKL